MKYVKAVISITVVIFSVLSSLLANAATAQLTKTALGYSSIGLMCTVFGWQRKQGAFEKQGIQAGLILSLADRL